MAHFPGAVGENFLLWVRRLLIPGAPGAECTEGHAEVEGQ